MDIFICWSGDASHVLAEGLRLWLPRVIHAARPFLSSEDIRKGRSWNKDLRDQLAKSNFAILCMTPENVSAPWILFEAGAAAKDPGLGQVSAVMIDVKVSDLADPLQQFQHTFPVHQDVRKLVGDINVLIPAERQTPPEALAWSFDKAWPDFEVMVQSVRDKLKQNKVAPPPKRDAADLLEELLGAVRDLQRRDAAELAKDTLSRLDFARLLSKYGLQQSSRLGNLGIETADTPLVLRDTASNKPPSPTPPPPVDRLKG